MKAYVSSAIYELTYPDLEAWLRSRGQPSYRAKQIFEWAYQKAARDFEEMTNLPEDLRHILPREFTIGPFPSVDVAQSPETEKHLVELSDHKRVECVSIEMRGAPTFCLSTQIGCRMGCRFCASTIGGCERNLTSGEILQEAVTLQSATQAPGNIVFMGVGEPLLNLESVVEAIGRFTDKRAFGLSASRITISTCGVVPGILKLAHLKLGVELAVSLGGSSDELRKQLMPGASKWSLEELVAACAQFTKAHKGQPVTFAYVLMDGVNDTFDDARRLGFLLRPLRHHLNLIPLNPTGHPSFKPPPKDRLNVFLEECRRHGLNVSIRHSKGGSIDAACGQLRQSRQQADA